MNIGPPNRYHYYTIVSQDADTKRLREALPVIKELLGRYSLLLDDNHPDQKPIEKVMDSIKAIILEP